MFEFSISLVFFWIKGHLSVDSRFIKMNIPNTILGIIPAGKNKETIPLKTISNLKISTRYRIFHIIFGIAVMIASFSYLRESFFGAIICFIIGVAITGSGIQEKLSFQKSGTEESISVPFFEKNVLQNIEKAIISGLEKETDKSDLSMYFDKKEVN